MTKILVDKAVVELALNALKGGLWDYGPGQDEHDKCNEVIAVLEDTLAQSADGMPVRNCDGLLCNDCNEYKQKYKDLPGLTDKDLCKCEQPVQVNVNERQDSPMNVSLPLPDYRHAYAAEQAEQEPMAGVLPCPFCGDNKPTVFEGSTFRWRVAVCNNCGAYAPEVRHNTLAEDQKQAGIESDAAAITAWNTRAAPVRTKDLTDNEIAMCMGKDLWNVYKNQVDFARAVIAADREKNK